MAKRRKRQRDNTDSAITDPRAGGQSRSGLSSAKASRQGDTTDPRAVTNAAPDWNLPTIAATLEEAHALMQRRRSSVSGSKVPKTRLGEWFERVREIASANPLATFAAGFACAFLVMIFVWVFGK